MKRNFIYMGHARLQKQWDFHSQRAPHASRFLLLSFLALLLEQLPPYDELLIAMSRLPIGRRSAPPVFCYIYGNDIDVERQALDMLGAAEEYDDDAETEYAAIFTQRVLPSFTLSASPLVDAEILPITRRDASLLLRCHFVSCLERSTFLRPRTRGRSRYR